MLIIELERLAEIARADKSKALKQFVLDELEAGDMGVHFHIGIIEKVNKILDGGKS